MRRTENAGECGDSNRERHEWRENREESDGLSGVTNSVTNGAAAIDCAFAGFATVTLGSTISGRHACGASPFKAVNGADSWWHDAAADVASSSMHSHPHASSRPGASSIKTTSRNEVERTIDTLPTIPDDG